jgi:hypothetical protein
VDSLAQAINNLPQPTPNEVQAYEIVEYFFTGIKRSLRIEPLLELFYQYLQ